jgi:conjugal transfer/entry exclusion protein
MQFQRFVRWLSSGWPQFSVSRLLRSQLFAVPFLLFTALPAFAILGVGDVVYDPANFEEAVAQLAQMAQQYEQLVQTYEMTASQYQQMIRMARQLPLSVLARYRGLSTPLRNFAAQDSLGNVSAWNRGMNSGADLDGAFDASSEKLGSYEPVLGNVPEDQLDRVKSGYASAELTEGMARSAMQTVGELRGSSAAVEAAIGNLENDSLSDDDSLNTEMAVLNKINATGVLALRNANNTNKLLVALTDAQIIAAKQQRDAEAQAINNHIRFLSEEQALLASQAANASTALSNWRMP